MRLWPGRPATLFGRIADDLAALSAQTWVELPPETRRDFEDELARNGGTPVKISGV